MDLWKTVRSVASFAFDTLESMNEKHQETIEKMKQKSDEQLFDMVDGKTNNKAKYAANELKNRGYSESSIATMMKSSVEEL